MIASVKGGTRGSALVLSLMAVVIVVLLATSFTQFASSVANRQGQAVFRKQAFYMAEAGLSEAFAGLMCGKSGNVGLEESPALFGDGVFWVEATELGVDHLQLESTGMVGSGRVVLSVVAERGETSVLSLGVFANQSVTLAPGSVIDAYDSTQGTYASQTDKGGATLGSNASLSLSGTIAAPTTVNGSVTPGPGGTLTTSGAVTITGSTAPALESTGLPEVEVPEIALAGAQVHDSPYPLVIPPGQSGYESLTVKTGSQALIQGPATVVLGTLLLESGAELDFDTSQGAVLLYVEEVLDLASGSWLTTSGTAPEEVVIQVPEATQAPVSLRSSTQFFGVVYAPLAQVTVASTFEVFGALVADQLSFEGAAKLHFDRHLGQVAAEESLPTFLAWRIISLASSSSDLASDPFTVLGVDRGTLEQPAEAHEDQLLKIDYYDAADVYHVYSGWESEFDWSVVKTVISATRDGTPVLFPRSTAPRTGVPKKPGTLPIVDGPML